MGFLIAQLVKNLPAVQETLVRFLGQEDPLEKGKATHSSILVASLVAQLVKKSACNVGDLGSIPGLGRSPGEGKGYPLQYSALENFMDCIVHKVAESRTQLSDFHFIIIDIIIISKAYNLEIYKHGKNYKLIVIKFIFMICRAASHSDRDQERKLRRKRDG